MNTAEVSMGVGPVPAESAPASAPPVPRRAGDTTVAATGAGGLTAAEVAERVAAGRTNAVARSPTRTVGEIVHANVFTRFNAILGALLVVILIVGPFQDALFGLILVSNTAIGIVQEVRAKRTLDRLALVTAPRVRLVRDARVDTHRPDEVVADDLIDVSAGDQLVVDGVVREGTGLEVDESLVSGESEPVAKHAGDVVLSGSFVAAGSGRFVATAVGDAAYAARLSTEARRFTLVRSELRDGINTMLRVITWVMVPTAVLLVWSQLASNNDLRDALRGSVAGVVTMVPEGLVLLTSIAFAVGVVRLGRRRVVVNELAAIEGLARVDTLCIDKTGTLTSGTFQVVEVVPLDPTAPVADVLGAIAGSDPHPNASLRALASSYDVPAGWQTVETVPFSSARKWSAATFAAQGSWVLGAPEILLDGVAGAESLRDDVSARAAAGDRVLLVARADRLDGDVLPAALRPAALVVLAEQLRPDAEQTLRYFAEQGVAVKVISGDHPRTVGAVAQRLGLALADSPVDARDLPDDEAAVQKTLEGASVFGRVTPEQKRAMVRALQAHGHVVAMTGDGVNDVPALKDADIGVAMGAGTEATRAVAQVVLLDNAFDAMPGVVGEGRRVIGNIERVANLFLTKTVYATLLAIAVGVVHLPFPFLPRHLTLVSAFTIGIPGFFLALVANTQRARPGFLLRVLRFVVPAGVVAAAATFTAYAVARSVPEVSLAEARTTATLVLFSVALWVLSILARSTARLGRPLVVAMAAGFLAVLCVPYLREFFALDLPPLVVWLAGAGTVALATIALEGGWRAAMWVQRRG